MNRLSARQRRLAIVRAMELAQAIIDANERCDIPPYRLHREAGNKAQALLDLLNVPLKTVAPRRPGRR